MAETPRNTPSDELELEAEHRAEPVDDGAVSMTEPEILDLITSSEIGECKLVPWGSNYTFAVSLHGPEETSLLGIYKPSSGEIPLWDFDAGTLYKREYASYLLSRLLGWHFIPPTVVRDGPHGIGTVQLYIEPETRLPHRSIRRAFACDLERIFLFDLLTNNADRKTSHFFVGIADRRLWGIDHGLTFHVHPKLRTVIWDFCGAEIREELLADVGALSRREREARSLLGPHLRDDEIDMLFSRVRAVLVERSFPALNPRRNVPYGW